MDYELDDDKDQINRAKHGVPLALGNAVFAGPYIEEEDRRYNYAETRFMATGPVAALNDRVFVVVYTWRGTIRRLISVRKANDREARKYRKSHP